MINKKIISAGCILSAVFVVIFTACSPDPFHSLPSNTLPNPDYSVTTTSLNCGGATHLIPYDGKILIGHNMYDNSGCLQYYDPVLETVNSTGVTDIDVARLAYDTESGRIYFNNSTSTYYIDTTDDPESWKAVEVTSGPAPGSDMLLYNDTIFVLYTSWTSPVNTLYIIEAATGTVTDTIDLNQGDPTGDDGLTKIGIDPLHDTLYFTDTWTGNIYCCNLDGSDVSYVITTATSSNGPIYFQGSNAYVLVGYDNQGLFAFNAENPATAADHFIDSGDISAQYMVFKDTEEAFVTNYGGGVYRFDPTDTGSDFSILPDTDPQNMQGLQDIILYQDILYITVNNYGGDSSLMLVENF